MDMRAIRETYVLGYRDYFELDLGLTSNAWRKNCDHMKDSDWIDSAVRWDGMATTDGKLYVVTESGELQCWD